MPRGRKARGSIRKRGEYLQLDYQTPLGRVRESANTTDQSEALNILQRRLGEIASGRAAGPQRITVEQLLKLLEDDYAERDCATLRDLQMRIRKNLIPSLGKMRAGEVTPVTIRSYITKRKAQKAAVGTIKKELAFLKRAFNLGLLFEVIYRVPKFPPVASGAVREGFLDPDQYHALLRELPTVEIQTLFVLGFHLGVRKGRLKSLKKSEVDMTEGLICPGGKQAENKGTGRNLPIYGEMGQWLALLMAHGNAKDNWLFHLGDFRKAWSSACKRAGIPGLLFHDLRRTAARNMIRAGIDEKRVMEIVGWKTRAMLDRYNITDTRDIKDAGQKAERWLADQFRIMKKRDRSDRRPN